MNKKLVAVAIAGLLAAPLARQIGAAEISPSSTSPMRGARNMTPRTGSSPAQSAARTVMLDPSMKHRR